MEDPSDVCCPYTAVLRYCEPSASFHIALLSCTFYLLFLIWSRLCPHLSRRMLLISFARLQFFITQCLCGSPLRKPASVQAFRVVSSVSSKPLRLFSEARDAPCASDSPIGVLVGICARLCAWCRCLPQQTWVCSRPSAVSQSDLF